jgi:hypothetical protein
MDARKTASLLAATALIAASGCSTDDAVDDNDSK